MRRRYGRRKIRRQWFPVEGQADVDEILPTGEDWAFTTGTLVIPPAGSTGAGRALDVIGLTFDFPPEEIVAAGTAPSLADWQGSAWQLSSIVGKFHVAMRADASGQLMQIFQTACIMAWFAVLEVDDTGTPRQADLFEYDPMLASNIREPYVFRRSWILGKSAKDNAGVTIAENSWPQANDHYGSVMDGPHFETKSGRFIGQNERLFFGVSACSLADPGGFAFGPNKVPNGIVLDYMLDYRLVGNLRKFTNRKNTAI